MTTTEHLESLAPVDALATTRSPEAADAAPSPRRDRGRLLTVAVVVLTLSPLIGGAVSIVQRGFPPGALFGDRAILGLTADNAWRAPVLLGPYSRFYWHHPGPLYFYVLNVLGTVFGGGTVGFVLGAVAINVAAATGILLLALRRGGRALLVWAALLLTAYLVAIDPIPFDIWNPSVTLLPFVLALLLVWSITCRDWWAAPVFAFVASFIVQTHVGLVPGIAVAVLFAIVVCVSRQRTSDVPLPERGRRRLGHSLLVSTGVLFLVWLPPVVQELTNHDGNLSGLVRFFTKPVSPHTLAEGLTNTALQVSLIVRGVFEPVSLRADTEQGLAVAVIVSALVFVVAVVLARRVRRTDALVLLALVAIEVPVGVYAITRIAGPIQFYLVQWVSAVGFLLWFAAGHAALEYLRVRRPHIVFRPAIARAALVVALVLLCVSAARAVPGHAGLVNEDLDVPNNRELFGYVPATQLLAATRGDEAVALRLDSVTAWEVMAADALLLVEHGRQVEIIETPVTRLLFDDALLVSDVPEDGRILAFRDRPKLRLGAGAVLVAHQGEWSIVDVED